MKMDPPVDELSKLDDWSALEVLGKSYESGGLVIDDRTIIDRFLDSDDAFVRERAIFLFGIKAKRSDLCEKFHLMLAKEAPANFDVISGLILSIVSCSCDMDFKTIRGQLNILVNDSRLLDKIGNVLVGFIFVICRRIDRTEFKPYLIKGGRPEESELQAARDCIQDFRG